MFRNPLKAAFRNLWKHRSFGFMNIAGLSIGIACAAFIFLWVEDELTFNHNFTRRDYLYRVMQNERSDNGINTNGDTPDALADAIKSEIPGVANTGRISWPMDELAVIGDKKIRTNGLYADPSFVDMCTLDFVHGDAATALRRPQDIIISQSLARACFGDDDPIGKTLNMDAGQAYSVDGLYTVVAVFSDLPANCSFGFQWISPYTTWTNANSWLKGWGNTLTETYVQLAPSASRAAIGKKLTRFLADHQNGATNTLLLFNMNDWHLRDKFENGIQTGGAIRYVRLFSLIASIILLIACINFMNLSTARSGQRAREVGVLKVIGANRGSLVGKFIGEALLLSFLSVGLAVVLLYIFLPAYNTLVNKQLHINLLHPAHGIGLLAVAVVAGLVAGSYPAFYLSSFNPIHVLKGLNTKSGGGVIAIRKGLVVTQFTASVGLIIGTIIVYQQVRHIKDRDLGYTRNNLVYMDMHGNMKDHFYAIKDELIATGYVENAAVSLHDALHVYSYGTSLTWPGKDPNSKISVHMNQVSQGYLATMHMKLIGGRDFYPTPGIDSNKVIINESMARAMGKEGRLGGTLMSGIFPLHVIGIMKDYIYNDVYGAGAPLVFFDYGGNATVMALRFKPGVDLQQALAKTGAVITAENPDQPFAYRFADEDFNRLFTAENLIGRLAGIFAVLAVVISCLGLFGLAAYTAERRVKEIGIRKVLGASVQGLTGLLVKEFVQLVTISCLIAFPLSAWLLHGWLQGYAYRTDLHWWVFGLSAVLAMAIAVFTVGFQAIRAALANPIKALRSE
ncbi:MAG TPA: ABC transporter permease [Dinghuibacter sp.]|uniref:ABC transporter permease n=1 Tax=Dinghuibacter sp. TaxID=2024697 RepID=UPI002BA5E6C3|nr:ABC transporter permease [Dinghuibacter sp.]HTJ13088.1 ABC transporter permease [Dinghuibacter sp.]